MEHKPESFAAEEKRQSRIDYAATGFVLKKPYSNTIVRGPVVLADRTAHKKLIDAALKHNLRVWYGLLQSNESGKRFLSEPLLVDFDSVPGGEQNTFTDQDQQEVGKSVKKIEKVVSVAQSNLTCKCGKVCTSKPGFTLHKKTCKEQ